MKRVGEGFPVVCLLLFLCVCFGFFLALLF